MSAKQAVINPAIGPNIRNINFDSSIDVTSMNGLTAGPRCLTAQLCLNPIRRFEESSRQWERRLSHDPFGYHLQD